MIANLFSTDNNKNLPSLPKDVKEAVSKCREATQEALKNRISRMDIEFPVGTKFNVEKSATKSKGPPSLQDFQRSDRELARLFVDMFQPVGGDRIAVIFKDDDQAKQAKNLWKGDASAASRILALNRGKKQRTAKKSLGFANKLAAELEEEKSSGPFSLPENIEVALFVSPGPKELVVVEKICDQVGDGTLVVLLNTRLASISNFGSTAATKLFTQTFESVFHLAAAPQDAAPNCLLHRAYPKDWVLARKPAVGPPKSMGRWSQRPTLEECASTFQSLQLSDVERGVENVVENVASWLK
ncbi:hypothetical protein FisN_14Hh261 [Fistulifera solaris]|uniref:DUF1995 domain-containing protein n=1 Tax=Fistulifera solaris TaxID=1519565 RepID=A0A1Z5KBU0_FISSO|nr:hypothetical protein FisN_14Hh261 [Fistulifera solaris]|eukprot:GAX23561.1 hypothetical protein FisN_14Hh261 [Fistulifera solaris]